MSFGNHFDTVLRRGGWNESITITEDGEALDLTGITARVTLYPQDDSDEIIAVASTVGTSSGGVVSFTFTPGQMTNLEPGQYDVSCVVGDGDDAREVRSSVLVV